MNSGRPLADAAVKRTAHSVHRGQTLLLSFEPPPFGLNRISTDPGGLQKVKDLSCRVPNWVKAFVTAAGDVERELFFIKSLQPSDCVGIQDVVFMGQAQ